MYILNIIDTLEEWLKPVQEWIYNHHNPLLGVAVLLAGLGAFFFLYSALHRD